MSRRQKFLSKGLGSSTWNIGSKAYLDGMGLGGVERELERSKEGHRGG